MAKNPIFALAEIFPINVNAKFKLRMIEILKAFIKSLEAPQRTAKIKI